MCTVTLFRSAERLLVTMNRDERRTRADEREPRRAGGRGHPRWIGPVDGETGGTWFGVNDQGMVGCLLNAYAAEDIELFGRDDVPSRGGIIPELLLRAPTEARNWLDSDFDPSPYPSFTLVLATTETTDLYSWRLDTGVARTALEDGWVMVTSSWWRTAEVVEWRREQFKSWCDQGASEVNGVPSFNLLEVPDRREWSPMMTRSFSITRSLTQAEVRRGASTLELRYWRRDGEAQVDPMRPTDEVVLGLARPLPRH